MTWCFKATLQLPKGRLVFAEKWPLCDPNELSFILITYLVFVFMLGPYIMEKRNPMKLNRIIIVYNAFKVINSAFLGYRMFVYLMNKALFPSACKSDAITVFIIGALYWKYMITKTFDLIDTVFFVLRKNTNHITFLHVCHHVLVIIITWTTLKYDPSDHWAFMAFADCAIHTAIYTYNAIAEMRPAYSKYLWWKKYLTVMQLIEFALVCLHIVIQTYTLQCPIQFSTYWIGLSNLILFLILFADYYRKRYRLGVPIQKVGLACTSTRRED